jgi:effector-binding domain-containing protein
VSDALDVRNGIEIKDVPEQPALLVRERIRLDRLSDAIRTGLEEVAAQLRAEGIAPAGPPFVLYTSMEDGVVDVEIGGPVEGEARGAGRVEYSVLPAATMLTYRHQGHYQELGRVHQALWELVEREGVTVDGAPREVYVTDPEEVPDPAEWVTVIQFPIVRDDARIAALTGS